MNGMTLSRIQAAFALPPGVGARLCFTLGLALLMLTAPGCGREEDESPPSPPPGVQFQRNRMHRSPAADFDTKPDFTAELPRDSKIPVYELRMEPQHVAALERNPYSNETYPATFVARGTVYENARVRVRGAWSRSWHKKSLKIQFAKEHRFEGRETINLNSGWRDPAFVREPLAYHVYTVCGAPSLSCRMVRLQLNGKFRGLYVEVEQPEKAFLERANLKGASVFKASSRGNQADERDLGTEDRYRMHYSKETRKQSGYADLREFCQDLARTTNAADFFVRRVDLDGYVNYLAATALVQNWDGFNKNHFLVHDEAGSGKWLVLPWDLDRTFGDHWSWSFEEARLPVFLGTRQAPGVTGWNRLEDRFFSDSGLRKRFLARLAQLLESEFTVEKMNAVVDQLETQIRAEAEYDRRLWPGPTPDLRSGMDQLKSVIEQRRAFLLEELRRLHETQ
jgi:spore coat protein H